RHALDRLSDGQRAHAIAFDANEEVVGDDLPAFGDLEAVLERVVHAPPGERPPARDATVDLHGTPRPSQEVAKVGAPIPNLLLCCRIDVRVARLVGKRALHPLAQLESEKLRNEPTPARLDAAGGVANDDHTVLVHDTLDSPCTTTE